jgi:hypothetical protein
LIQADQQGKQGEGAQGWPQQFQGENVLQTAETPLRVTPPKGGDLDQQ